MRAQFLRVDLQPLKLTLFFQFSSTALLTELVTFHSYHSSLVTLTTLSSAILKNPANEAKVRFSSFQVLFTHQCTPTTCGEATEKQ